MDIFNASAMGMIFHKVNLDDLLGGNSQKLSQAQEDIAGQLGSVVALIGGLSPALQQQMTEAMETRFPQAVGYMVSAGHLAMQHRDKLANIPQYLRQLGSGGVQILSAGQIAAGTTSAFITMCHVVASYDNAVKLADANVKLDDLLKVHGREYKARLECVYHRIADLFLELGSGHAVAESLKNCSQELDQLILIWLDEIHSQLDPVQTSTTGLKAYSSAKSWLPFSSPSAYLVCGVTGLAILTGPMALTGHIVYSRWIDDIRKRLDRISPLLCLMGIGIWLRHVISHHTRTRQPLHRYADRLQQIATTASSIKDAVVKSEKLIKVDAQVMKQLQWVENVPQRIHAMLTKPWDMPDLESNCSGSKYTVSFVQSTESFCVEDVS